MSLYILRLVSGWLKYGEPCVVPRMRKHKTVYSTIMTTTKMTETEGFLCIIEILCKLLKYKGWNQILKQPPKKDYSMTSDKWKFSMFITCWCWFAYTSLVPFPQFRSRAQCAIGIVGRVSMSRECANGIVGSIHANFSKSSVGILCVATFRRISNSRHFVVMLNYSTIL